jgi:hypothetical protein
MWKRIGKNNIDSEIEMLRNDQATEGERLSGFLHCNWEWSWDCQKDYSE